MKVYVFGAGASRHAGFPLASTMARDLLTWMRANRQDLEWPTVAEQISERFSDTDNFEDLLTAIDTRLQRMLESEIHDERVERHILINCRATLRTAVREWFRGLRNQDARAYAIFAERVIERGDVVVSFNYDDRAEKELRRVGIWDIRGGYGFPVVPGPAHTDTLFLKLHGSVNWLASLFGGVTSGVFAIGPGTALGVHPVIAQDDLRFLGYENIVGTFSGGGAIETLIMPAREKEFFFTTSFGDEWRDFWDEIWSQAANAVNIADDIVIAGYSLPDADARARALLLDSGRVAARVTVVCGSDTERIVRQFREHGFHDVHGRKEFFQEWVVAQNATAHN